MACELMENRRFFTYNSSSFHSEQSDHYLIYGNFNNEQEGYVIHQYALEKEGITITLDPDFKMKLLEITKLSKKINKNDKQKILHMMKDHVFEIEELYNEKNEHWAIETADLIVLSYELLLMENKDIDEVFRKCLPRFDKKLKKKFAENTN